MWRSLFPEFVRGRGAIGLLILRVAVGAAFVFHGWFKITSPGGMTAWMGPGAPCRDSSRRRPRCRSFSAASVSSWVC